MRMLRAEVLQWVGLFAAGVAWASEHLLVFSASIASCGPVDRVWGVPFLPLELAFYAVALVLALAAEAAAVTVVLRTREASYDDAGPIGRQHFFALGAALGNLLFINAIILNAVGTLAHTCHQS